jgi:hypothetical protein
MASKKPIAPKEVAATPAATFEADIDLSLAVVAAMATSPEMKTAIKDLKESIINAHNRYLNEVIKEKDLQYMSLQKDADMMYSDINALKTTVLRMAITQFGN